MSSAKKFRSDIATLTGSTQTPAFAPKKKRLRIAILNRIHSPAGGGAERYSIALMEQMSTCHDIHVFAQIADHECPDVTFHQVSMPFTRPRWINQLWYATVTWWATREGFDVVHSHENTWHGNVQTVHVLPIKHTLFVNLTGWRLVLRLLKVVTSPRLVAYLLLETFRYSVGRCRKIVLTSPSLKRIMEKTYPNANSAMSVITPGVSSAPGRCEAAERTAARRRLGLPQYGLCILFVANDYRKKGLEALISSLKELPDDVFLTVVGNAHQINEFQPLVAANGVVERIFFLGSMKDVSDAYIASNCLVHPTLQDTFAMAVLEAMAHGLPVITSGPAYCGISELLVDGLNALILKDPRDVKALTSAITQVLRDPVLNERMSVAACAFARDYLWSTLALRQESTYYAAVEATNAVCATGSDS